MSLGFSSTKADCDIFLAFLKNNFLNKSPASIFDTARAATSSLDVIESRSEGTFSAVDIDSLCLSRVITTTHLSNRKSNDRDGDTAPQQQHLPVCNISKNKRAVTLAAIFVYPIKSCAGKFG